MTSCTGIAIPLALQVTNPVVKFQGDNNGVILELPQIASTGAANVSGSLVFGIDTQSNNMMASNVVVLMADPGTGDISTTFNNSTYSASYIDSGSNLIYFNDSSITTCPSNSSAPGFFCPTSSMSLSATNTGTNGTTSMVPFSIENATTLIDANQSLTAFNDVGGPISGVGTGGANSNANSFDWGLPFFFGRHVYTAIQGQPVSQGTPPFFAY
jgi:hypothetical protein